MLIPPNYDQLNNYENIRFEEKFFSSTKEKINNEIKLYENWVLSILPSIESKYKNEILNSFQNSNLLMDLIEKIDRNVKFKRSKLSNVNKISNANSIVECLKYLNNKFYNQFQSIHYTDFTNGDRKKILRFLFLIKYSYERRIKNKDFPIVNIRGNVKKFKYEFNREEIIGKNLVGAFDVSDCKDLKESGFEAESESFLTDTEVTFDNEDKIELKKFDTPKNVNVENTKNLVIKFLKTKKKYLLSEIKIENSSDFEGENESKVEKVFPNKNELTCKNKEIYKLVKINSNERIESIQLFYREHDFVKIELDYIFPVFNLSENKLDHVTTKQKVQVFMHVNFKNMKKLIDTDSNFNNVGSNNQIIDKNCFSKEINSNSQIIHNKSKPRKSLSNKWYETFYYILLYYINDSII